MSFGVVGVGIIVAHDLLRGSGRAELPHPALASASYAKEAVQRIRMRDAQRGQPAVNQPPHPVPGCEPSQSSRGSRLRRVVDSPDRRESGVPRVGICLLPMEHLGLAKTFVSPGAR
jgi:hypothetical protein